jgi:hypothetical protein
LNDRRNTGVYVEQYDSDDMSYALLKNKRARHVVNEFLKRRHDLVTDAYNKMKHADVDPEGAVEVSEDEPRALMTLAATDLMRLKEISTKEISDFIEFVRTIKSLTPQSPA